MGPQLRFLFIIGYVLLGIWRAEGSENKQCPEGSYKTADGICCDLCPAGTFKAENCLIDGEISKCIPCLKGVFYTDKPNYESACFDCTSCPEGEEMAQECTREHDIVCHCKEGYYRSNGQCFYNKKEIIIGMAIFTSIMGIIITIVSLWMWRKQTLWKRRRSQERERLHTGQQRLDRGQQLLDREKRSVLEEKKSIREEKKSIREARERLGYQEHVCSLLSAEQERLKLYEDQERLRLHRYGCSPTFNPNSANNKLMISSDLRTVTLTSISQGRPDHADRFDTFSQALSSESFSMGQHYWEVEVMNTSSYRVGVAYGKIKRRGSSMDIFLGFNNVSWCLRKKYNILSVQHGSVATSLKVQDPPQTVGIHVDWEAGILSFYNAATTFLLYRFHHKFTEPLYPAIQIYSSDEPLTFIDLSPVPEQNDCAELK